MVSTDRDALLALYNATGGKHWNEKANWNTDAALLQWHGVKVNDQDRVVELHLTGNNLKGLIPPELGHLRELKELYLGNNKLTGSIPAELGNLNVLVTLELGNNKLSGHIPRQLGDLGALEMLDLSNNKLEGPIPPELGNLRELVVLRFGNNRLTGRIPEELGKLTALQELTLYENQLSGPIPPEIGKLAALKHLELQRDQLTGPIPAELGALSELRQLYLHNNQLTGTIPSELGNLVALWKLDLSWNKLSGPIPPELGKLTALVELRLGNNQLSGLWDTLGQKEAGSIATRPGTLPVALASLLDSFDRLHRVGGGRLDLSQNPWEHPPEAIVTGGMLAVRGYFEAIFRGGTTVVTRPLKVVIVGMETVGKTSLRCSIKAGEPCMTRGGGVDSTVHVDVQDHNLDVQDHKAGGHPIRIFDCAGQAAYYGLLQLFLTPCAVYLLVWDAEKASQMDELNLEDLAIAPWLRQMTFRVPDANVVLVGNKWDLVAEANLHVADDVERKSREWLTAWIESAHRHQPPQLSLEAGVSLVSCAPSGRAGWAPSFGGRKAWPCDKNKPGQPGLFRRIIYNPVDDMRAVTMRLSPVYVLALNLLEELASRSRSEAGQQTRVMTRASLKEEWKARVDALGTAGTTAAASEAALSGAILIRKWEGGLVEYGNYIFLDVGWFADVLDPLFNHKEDSNGIIRLGGKTVTVTDDNSLKRLHTYHIFEPRLAEDIWGAELAPHLLSALNSAGLTFPIPNDPCEGLVVVLRMDTEPPPDYRAIVEGEQARKYYDLRLVVQCSFRLGLPPGFVERLLARCCHLGFPHPFWRYGALVVGAGAEEGKFSLTLEYSEEDKTLKVQVNGRCNEVHAWATLSRVLSVTIKMLSEFPGLPCQLEFLCPRHEDKSMRLLKANNRPGSRLVEQGYFCPLCPDRTAGNDLLGVALQVVEYSDTEFSDARLREQFAGIAKRVARQGRALWPALVMEVQAPNHGSPDRLISDVTAPNRVTPGRKTPLYRELKAWVAAATLACFAIFGVFAGKDDDDSRLWGVFLGLGILLSGAEFVLIAKHYEILCFKRKEEAGAGHEHGGEESA